MYALIASIHHAISMKDEDSCRDVESVASATVVRSFKSNAAQTLFTTSVAR